MLTTFFEIEKIEDRAEVETSARNHVNHSTRYTRIETLKVSFYGSFYLLSFHDFLASVYYISVLLS